jgi:hypothetical protein
MSPSLLSSTIICSWPHFSCRYVSPMHDIIASTGILDHYNADGTQEYQSFNLTTGAIYQQLAFSYLDVHHGTNEVAIKQTAETECRKDICSPRLINIQMYAIFWYPVFSGWVMLLSHPTIITPFITPSPVVQNLGVLFDSHLTMDLQIRSTCRKAYFPFRRKDRIKRFLSSPAISQQNSAARLITGSRRFYNIPQYFVLFIVSTLNSRSHYCYPCVSFFDCCCPQYLIDSIKIRRSSRPPFFISTSSFFCSLTN